MTKFDPTKPVKTRDGRKARILATDIKDDTYPIAAAVTNADGSESPMYYCMDGTLSGDPRAPSPGDLVNLPDPPAALNFANGVGARVCPESSAVVQFGSARDGQWKGVIETDVPALIRWLQQYLVSRS